MIVWGIVSIVILLLSYLLIVKPILDDTDEQIDRAFDQSEQIQENAFDSAEELQDSIQDDVNESIEEGVPRRRRWQWRQCDRRRERSSSTTRRSSSAASRARAGTSTRASPATPSSARRAGRYGAPAPQKIIEVGSSGSTLTVIVLPASTPLIEPSIMNCVNVFA